MAAVLTRQYIDGERISTIPKFLTNDECQELIERAEVSGFKLSPPSGRLWISIITLLFKFSLS